MQVFVLADTDGPDVVFRCVTFKPRRQSKMFRIVGGADYGPNAFGSGRYSVPGHNPYGYFGDHIAEWLGFTKAQLLERCSINVFQPTSGHLKVNNPTPA